MSILFYLKKIGYLIFNDYHVSQIEEVLNCKVSEHGYYFPRYTSYLIKDNLDTNKLNQLENILKCHCELIRKDYSYVLKCYYRYSLPSFIPFNYHPSNEICLGESYDGRFKISFKSYTHMIVGGTTGSGKSNLIASILLNLNCDKLYLDLKGRSR